jgi:glucose/arabinose dehydrogenase/PKD repeat protein
MHHSRVTTMASFLLRLLCLLSAVSALPEGFVDEAVVRVVGASSATFAQEASGDWLLFLATKEGSILVATDPFSVDTSSTLLLTLNPCTSGERGVQTILAHPKFAENGWLYVYYAPYQDQGCSLGTDPDIDYSGPHNQLSRFQYQNGKLGGEVVLLSGPPNKAEIHNGGAMNFGPDGYLYLALGEGGTRAPPYSQYAWTLHGKMLRITEDGSIPPDNPFASTGISCKEKGRDDTEQGSCQEIFSFGLRNPFRFAMDPNSATTRYYINDVGGKNWEEVSEGGADSALANYGWPEKEGPCIIGSYTSCPFDEPTFLDPIHWFSHLNSTGGETGKAIVGGAFVPNGVWPAEYDNTYLFAEFVEGKIFHMTEDSSLACRSCLPPTSAYKETLFHEWERTVDIFFGPYLDTQALYYITRIGDINVRRIRFTGSNNRSPVASILATTGLEGLVPFTVNLDASNSTDPDANEVLSYSWDFGDASELATTVQSSHTYTTNGTYLVEMTVADQAGLTDQAFLTVVVGTPPTVTMDSPVDGATFAVGELFWLNATATDSAGQMLGATSLTWEMRQHHDTHWHPYLSPTEGNGVFSKAAPAPEDFLAATNSYLEILVTATDSQGLQTTVSRNIMPRSVYIDFDTRPSNLEVLLVEEYVVTTPARILSWENHLLRVDLLLISDYLFDSWSDGENRSHSIQVPASNGSQTVPSYVMTLRTAFVKPVVRVCSETQPCGLCEGHCESTAGCGSGLACYDKPSGETTVPGCDGTDNSRTKWCTYEDVVPTTSPMPSAVDTSITTMLPAPASITTSPMPSSTNLMVGTTSPSTVSPSTVSPSTVSPSTAGSPLDAASAAPSTQMPSANFTVSSVSPMPSATNITTSTSAPSTSSMTVAESSSPSASPTGSAPSDKPSTTNAPVKTPTRAPTSGIASLGIFSVMVAMMINFTFLALF